MITPKLTVQTATMQMGAALGVTIQFNLFDRQTDMLHSHSMENTVIVWLVGSFTCDILISLTMVAVLVRAREFTLFSSSKGVLDALIVHTIENGMVTTVCALVELGVFLGSPETHIHICL